MASTIKGEVPFQADGTTFKLVYDFNALCTIESELEVDVAEIGEKLNSPSLIRSVFRIGLAAHHPGMNDLEAGHLIHVIGVQTAADVIGRAFKAAFPDASAEGNGKAAKKTPGTTPRP